MSSYAREYVEPYAPMYRAAAYSADGVCVASTGPYATRGAASCSRSRITRRGVRVRVEECAPVWVAVPGTEVTR
ncbi:hypothetical protein [Micromonospora okii]|uniref:hypothetical protein n=1 Tax=Micromonospora okii TaxID=1182970 RepID=UPI001E6468A6|nr:hypothetical protein [Micromonospora okii]